MKQQVSRCIESEQSPKNDSQTPMQQSIYRTHLCFVQYVLLNQDDKSLLNNKLIHLEFFTQWPHIKVDHKKTLYDAIHIPMPSQESSDITSEGRGWISEGLMMSEWNAKYWRWRTLEHIYLQIFVFIEILGFDRHKSQRIYHCTQQKNNKKERNNLWMCHKWPQHHIG